MARERNGNAHQEVSSISRLSRSHRVILWHVTAVAAGIPCFGPAGAAANTTNCALQFGNGDAVKVADSATLDITGPITIEAWVKPSESIVDSFFNFIVSKNLDGTGYALTTGCIVPPAA